MTLFEEWFIANADRIGKRLRYPRTEAQAREQLREALEEAFNFASHMYMDKIAELTRGADATTEGLAEKVESAREEFRNIHNQLQLLRKKQDELSDASSKLLTQIEKFESEL